MSDIPPCTPMNQLAWELPCPGYAPVRKTEQVVLDNDCTVKDGGWADQAEFLPELLKARFSHWLGQRVPVPTDPETGRPRNPMGRTGKTGRGWLGKWGPNYAADPLVTRFHPETGQLQMAVIFRGDRLIWAIPGGMVDAGEQVPATLLREFLEETGGEEEVPADEPPAKKLKREQDAITAATAREMVKELFAQELEPAYVGYVKDPRNTDEAWMETTCVHFHIDSPFLAKHLKLVGASDALKAKWTDVSDENEDFVKLYASHRDMVIRALLKQPIKFAAALMKINLNGK